MKIGMRGICDGDGDLSGLGGCHDVICDYFAGESVNL